MFCFHSRLQDGQVRQQVRTVIDGGALEGAFLVNAIDEQIQYIIIKELHYRTASTDFATQASAAFEEHCTLFVAASGFTPGLCRMRLFEKRYR